VKQKNDYTLYAIISVFAFGFANVLNVIYSRKFVSFSFKKLDLKKHLKKLKIFFYSAIVVSMYTIFDQVFLGFLSTNKDVAFYGRAKQIYYFAISVTLSISTVLLPKLIYLHHTDFEQYKRLLKKSLNYIYIFSVPSVLGLMVLSKDIMMLFGGSEFAEAYVALIILSILVFTVSLGTWQYDQLYLPLGIEKIGLRTQIFMALASICGNLILIPKFGYIGASISLVMAEIFGTIYGVWYVKKRTHEVKVKYLTKSLVKYILAAFLMSLLIVLFRFSDSGYLLNIVFGVLVGSMVYFGVLYLIKDDICKEFISFIHKKISRKV
jgi:O-antigen/teichoic acid export membrane protein